MRRIAVILCILLKVSFLLIPFGSLHTHVSSDHHHFEIHGGHIHLHEDEHGHDSHVPDQVIDMHASADQTGTGYTGWIPGAVMLSVFLIGCFTLPYLIFVFSPPADVRLAADRRSYLHPPLRGPPAISI